MDEKEVIADKDSTYTSSSERDFIPHETKPSSPLRYIWIAIILFLVLSVVGVGAFVIDSEHKILPSQIGGLLTPTPDMPHKQIFNQVNDSAANWSKYTNTKVGFQIAYPPSFMKPQLVAGLSNEPRYAEGTEYNLPIILEGKTTSYQLIIFPFKGTLEDLFDERYEKFSQDDPITPVLFPDVPLKASRSAMIDGVKAYWYTLGNTDGSTKNGNELHFIGKNYGFIFRGDEYSGRSINKKEMEQIIATFKFIDPLSATPSAKTSTSSGTIKQ